MNSPDSIHDRGEAKAARTNCGTVRLCEQIGPAQLRSEPRIAQTQDETDLSQREIGRARAASSVTAASEPGRPSSVIACCARDQAISGFTCRNCLASVWQR